MARFLNAMSIGVFLLLYAFVGLIIGFAVAFVPLKLVHVLAEPVLLNDSVIFIVSLALAFLSALLFGAGYLRAREQ